MAEVRAWRWTAADEWPPTLQRLVWVVAGLALSVVPHVQHVKFWILLLAAGAAGLRIAMEVKHWQMLARWLRSMLAFVALLAVLLDYRTLNGVDAGTALLIVMAGMKLLETRTVRDLTAVRCVSLQPESAGPAVHDRHCVAADRHADAHPPDDHFHVGA